MERAMTLLISNMFCKVVAVVEYNNLLKHAAVSWLFSKKILTLLFVFLDLSRIIILLHVNDSILIIVINQHNLVIINILVMRYFKIFGHICVVITTMQLVDWNYPILATGCCSVLALQSHSATKRTITDHRFPKYN